MAIVYEALTGVIISMTVVTTVMKMAAVSLQDAKLIVQKKFHIHVHCKCQIIYTTDMPI